MTTATLDSDLRAELESLAGQRGCELLSAELAGGTLRLVLDRGDGAVGIEDCAAVSRQASALLDAHDFGDRRYLLEVSSPGLDRPLYGPRDYRRFAGQLARFTFEDPQTGNKRTVVGRIDRVEGDENGTPATSEARQVALADPDTGKVTAIPFERIHTARLEIEI